MAKPKTGTAQVNAELPAAFLDEVKAFAEGRGEKIRDVIYHALRRHLKYPPAPVELPAEPLPDSADASAPKVVEVPKVETAQKKAGKRKA